MQDTVRQLEMKREGRDSKAEGRRRALADENAYAARFMDLLHM